MSNLENEYETLYNGEVQLDFSRFTDKDDYPFPSTFLDNPVNDYRQPFVLRLPNIAHLLKNRKPKLIHHNEVWVSALRNPTKLLDYDSYQVCDIKYPPIVFENNNICSFIEQPYILLDGAHRMAKMLFETNIRKSYFYVINRNEFLSSISFDLLEEQDKFEKMMWFRNVPDVK